MSRNTPSVLRGIVTGLVAGIAATLVMDQFQNLIASSQKAIEEHEKSTKGESSWQIAHENAEKEVQASQQEGSTEIVARKIAEIAGKGLDQQQKKTGGQAVHYTFGTLMGVVYAVSAELLPEVATGGGTAFGTLLFLGADEVAVPALRLSSPPKETPGSSHLQHWAAHVVYGGALELSRNLLRRLW